MKLSEMRQLLESRGIQLTKSLGQNFLHDGNQLRRIVECAAPAPDDRVLEIGPGLGPLTELLLERAGRVLAIEKDRRLHEVLRERFGGCDKLELLHADALEVLRNELRDWSGWKLVSNLPYSVASPILVELAQAARRPKRMVATLQLEVVQRLVANPGDPDYGLLTLLVRVHYLVGGWFKIPASCFFPPPEVDSACVTLVRRSEPILRREEEPRFAVVVKTSFSQRRKMMFKLLRARWPDAALEAAFESAGVPAQARAETVGIEQFVKLTRCLPDRL